MVSLGFDSKELSLLEQTVNQKKSYLTGRIQGLLVVCLTEHILSITIITFRKEKILISSLSKVRRKPLVRREILCLLYLAVLFAANE